MFSVGLQHCHVDAVALGFLLTACNGADQQTTPAPPPERLDAQLQATLVQHQFTGTVEQQLETRLGRKLDPKLFVLGGQLFFDRAVSLPSISNTAFYPTHMWDGRFSAPSGDPFNNSLGYLFPQPEGNTRFRANDPLVTHLLVAQAFMPLIELNEMAGFTGIRDGLDPRYFQFDDSQGDTCPALDAGGSRNEPIRARVMARLNAAPAYVEKFGAAFSEVGNGAPIDMVMFGRAIAEFEFFQRAANAPIDRFARGEAGAMTDPEKHGALLFFGRANCVACPSPQCGRVAAWLQRHPRWRRP